MNVQAEIGGRKQSLFRRLRFRYSALFHEGVFAFSSRRWSMLNLGYAPASAEARADPAGRDEPFQTELYLQCWQALGRDPGPEGCVVELAAGRGGGLSILSRRTGARLIGVERSHAASATGRRLYGLDLRQGAIPPIPLPDASADAIFAVECSIHFFGPDYCAEVMRVLKPGGRLVQCDFLLNWQTRLTRIERQLRRAGLRRIRSRDIAANVQEACRLDGPRRARMSRFLPGVVGRELQNMYACEGTPKYRDFETGRRGYVLLTADKPRTPVSHP